MKRNGRMRCAARIVRIRREWRLAIAGFTVVSGPPAPVSPSSAPSTKRDSSATPIALREPFLALERDVFVDLKKMAALKPCLPEQQGGNLV